MWPGVEFDCGLLVFDSHGFGDFLIRLRGLVRVTGRTLLTSFIIAIGVSVALVPREMQQLTM